MMYSPPPRGAVGVGAADECALRIERESAVEALESVRDDVLIESESLVGVEPQVDFLVEVRAARPGAQTPFPGEVCDFDAHGGLNRGDRILVFLARGAQEGAREKSVL